MSESRSNYRGVAYTNMGESGQAVADFTEAMRLAPNLPQPYLGRAAAYRALGNEEEAAEDERKAQERMN